MVKMAAVNEVLPEQLFIENVTFGDLRKPWRCGKFADIFRGIYRSAAVVGKRLRIHDIGNNDIFSVRVSRSAS
jgi:hypothetical protein